MKTEEEIKQQLEDITKAYNKEDCNWRYYKAYSNALLWVLEEDIE